jgi:hypothetical protein
MALIEHHELEDEYAPILSVSTLLPTLITIPELS